VAIGTDRGIRVSQVSTRAALATYPTPFGVRAVAWFRDGQTIMATCDDAIRLFRLSGKSGDGTGPVRTVRGRHGDVIRCGALWQGGPNGEALGFTGSYDHTVRMWDLTPRAGIDDEDDDEYDDDTEGRCCLSVMVHGAPVEALVLLENTAPSADPPPGGGGSARRPWLVTAGGTHLKVWDLRTGACAGTYPTRHNKTVAALIGSVPRVALEDDGRTVRQARPRLVSGGLDGYLGFHAWDGSTGTIVPDLYGTRLRNDEGITALGGTAFRIAIGTVRGRVHVRDRAVGTSSSSRKRAAAQPRAGTYSFFARGMNATAGAGDYVVGADAGVDKKRKLHAYDVALKQFRYGDALDEALGTRAPKIVAAVLEELGRRRGLRIALSSRDEETLEPILAFTVRYIGQPRFAALLIGVSHMLIDIYSDVAGQSETIDELFAKLRTQVSTEARIQRKLLGVVGQLDGLIASVAHLDDDDESQ
jgi:U3 small nucleolar RNA-associated protein 15